MSGQLWYRKYQFKLEIYRLTYAKILRNCYIFRFFCTNEDLLKILEDCYIFHIKLYINGKNVQWIVITDITNFIEAKKTDTFLDKS